MITEADVRATPDDELLNIWANQHEYVEEMRLWVKAEIDRRHLDTSGIHVLTRDEIEAEKERESDRTFVRMVALLSGLLGGGLLFDLSIVGVVLIVFSIGVWWEWRWAIWGGLLACSFMTVQSVIATASDLVRGNVSLTILLGNGALIVITGALALAFNRLRKRRGISRVSPKIKL